MEALIDSSVLMEHLQSKHDEIPDKLGELVQNVSNVYRNFVVLEAPRITGNLKSSIRVEDVDQLSRRVYPDEGQAPYAIYVLKGVRGKATVEPNDFMGRGAERGRTASEKYITDFISWLKQ
ncbi:hypothetical protein [Methanobrevibacter sp.]|uniref:hypothetical protein n=1 Tax=Methanobrevibacter sp. TaxID=66852 RepID=UPI00388D72D9